MHSMRSLDEILRVLSLTKHKIHMYFQSCIPTVPQFHVKQGNIQFINHMSIVVYQGGENGHLQSREF